MSFDDAQLRWSLERLLDDLSPIDDLDDRAVVGDHDVVALDAELFGEVSVDAQHVVVTMHWDEELRADLAVDPRGLFAIAVARGVHVRGEIGDDLRTLAREIVL